MIEAFVGKGGVGKTSISSAYARICSRHGKVALISTDTMPSLSYIFPKKERNIDVFELSEEEIAKEWIRRYGDEVYEIASSPCNKPPPCISKTSEVQGRTEQVCSFRRD
ncbi:MAG: ArsA-related P-loop ATPase [Candidatus Micrarchaeia archaeon]